MPDLVHGLPPKPQPELTPALLASQWKKSGQFDKLRKRLLSDFLTSPDKDRLIGELDAILPTLFSSAQPPLSRIPRNDRLSHVLETLDRRDKAANPLERNIDQTRERLNKKGEKGSKGLGRTIERELRTCQRVYRGVAGTPGFGEEAPDSQEEEDAVDVGRDGSIASRDNVSTSIAAAESAANPPASLREPSNLPSSSTSQLPARTTVTTDSSATGGGPTLMETEDLEMKPIIPEAPTASIHDVDIA